MSSKFNYDSFGNSIEGTDYCSGVETFAQNLIEDNESDATISFPSPNGWATPRTEEYKLSDNNARIILPQNIYKPKSIKFKIESGLGYVEPNANTGSRFDLSEFHTQDGKYLTEIDVIAYIVDNITFNALSISKTFPQEALSRNNTLKYENNYIEIARHEEILTKERFNWQEALKSTIAYTDQVNDYYVDYLDKRRYLKDYSVFLNYTDPRKLKYQVSYIPMSSDIKLRARKSVRQQEEYIQPINQRAEINSASALGKFMYNTAQKMGTEQITLVKFYTKIGDIPPLGCRVKHNGQHYILTANSLEMTNCVQVKVTHTLSKNWSNKSQYVSVDQKYRNYKIPADILWRNMHWEDYIEITTDGVVENAEAGDLLMSVIDGSTTKRAIIPRIFMCDKTDDVTITSFFLYRANRESYDWGVTVSCTTTGTANSMAFSASMKDNLSAGLRISEENSQYCEEVFYCEENGKLDYARAVLSGGINITDAGAYPQATLTRNTPTDKVFDEIFYISKDPGEALKFTYQCHWISDEADIVIGSKLAENHPLVKKWTENRKFRFLALRKPLRQGEDKVRPEEHMDILILTDEQRKGYFGMQDLISDTQKAFKLMLVGAGLSLLNNAGVKAWAITDENYNLYIGCNDKSKTTLYFSHIHERI